MKLLKLHLTKFNWLITQNLWQVHYKILLIISKKMFCTGLNPACTLSEICDGEDLWQCLQLEIRLNAFHLSAIPQKQFTIMNIFSKPADSKQYFICYSSHPKPCIKKSFIVLPEICTIVEDANMKLIKLEDLNTTLMSQRYLKR